MIASVFYIILYAINNTFNITKRCCIDDLSGNRYILLNSNRVFDIDRKDSVVNLTHREIRAKKNAFYEVIEYRPFVFIYPLQIIVYNSYKNMLGEITCTCYKLLSNYAYTAQTVTLYNVKCYAVISFSYFVLDGVIKS
jgi:hypothetical protein